MKNLVIVESPTKAKTISKFLDKNFRIESSLGHVRDLPTSKMGIDIEHDFAPHYVIPTKAKKRVTELQSLAAKAETIYFATDEDREGEAIAWHLQAILKVPAKQVKRITFHEITKAAILKALDSPRSIDEHLVDAQQARRILDRLVGYELSPFLWKKVARGLSAGRVQSVAVRLIVEREDEIKAFRPQEYWTVDAQLLKDKEQFNAHLVSIKGKTLKKFDLKRAVAEGAVKHLRESNLATASVEASEVKKKAPSPLTTSTLQQDANRRFGFSTKQTMMLAQQLYEGIELGDEGHVGLITYMRTDSRNLSAEFTSAAADYLKQTFGPEYASDKPRTYSSGRNAQEAHEAIRPTDATRTPESIASHLDARQKKIYELIWSRALASQMPDARMNATTVDVTDEKNIYILRATGSTVAFAGWMKIYADSSEEKLLPKLASGDEIKLKVIGAHSHETQPPARYSEAGLVKALEAKGIGRPSTYAPTIATVFERKYVEKDQNRLKPTDMGILVTNLLKEHFADIVDYDFTAQMEDSLDEIAVGKKEWQPLISNFYHPFKKNLEEKEAVLSKKEITEEKSDYVCEKCGKPMVIKMGRFGKFLACTGYPDCKNTKQLKSDGKIEAEEPTGETCDICGKPMVIKRGRYGKFLGCSGYPECKGIKRIENSTGVACPKCGKGQIVEKKSKRGKLFYACNQYPDCEFALWSKPTGEKCPTCSSILVYGPKQTIKCSAKTCSYSREVEN